MVRPFNISEAEWQVAKKAATERTAQEHPELWRRCYPRVYNELPQGYYSSVKELAMTMLGAAVRIEEGYRGANELQEIIWASALSRYRVPVYWIAADIAEAIKQTTPPHRLNTAEMKLPFEAAAFMVPKGTLIHESDEGQAAFVSYVRVGLTDAIPSLARSGPRNWAVTNTGTITILAGTEAGHLLHWTLPDKEQVKLDELDRLVRLFEHAELRHTSANPLYSANLTPEDNRFMAKVAHFLFGTLILMTARPDLVTTGVLRKKVQKRKEELLKEFWSPSIIGEHFKLRREYEPLGGTHASPRGHWVHGFYREQSHGPHHSLRKEIWVEPFWRGGETELA